QDDDPDAQLVARAKFGDQSAFGELVKRHHRALSITARAILRSPDDVHDVVQDAWLRAYREFSQFHGAARFKTWMVAIVRHRAIDHQRVARRRRQREVAALTGTHMHARVRSPEQLALQTEQITTVTRAMRALPRRLRRPLQLWHSGRYSYEEIADIEGVAP